MSAPELPSGESQPPPRPAASLVLLRDSPEGLQALLLQRPGDDTVLAGAHVFPGGKLDREDAEAESLSRIDSAPEALHARLAEPELSSQAAAALYVAALREAFEETGVLLAHGADAALAERACALRRQGLAFGEVLAELDLRIQTSALQPWSRWITPLVPAMMKRRFDTRFFVARVPQGQAVVPDPREAVAADWLAPREALGRYDAAGIELAAPQIMTLVHLARFATVADAMADAAGRGPPVIRPEPVQTPAGRLVCYPGDPAHPICDRAIPGPTRLLFTGGRFAPLDGQGWFD
jgi:8-oxo-dGTP pyrophosphatase MutT (NUDIX family)